MFKAIFLIFTGSAVASKMGLIDSLYAMVERNIPLDEDVKWPIFRG